MTNIVTGRRSLRLALVLGSGGARGYTHIGVIEELEKRGHEVAAIAGSSMGAVVGGIYAAGALDTFKTLVMGLTRTDVLKYLDWSLHGPGMFEGDRIMKMLYGIVGGVRLEDLPIPTTIVATDIIAQREVWFNQGVIRASIAIPTAFTPVSIGGRVLADGGILNPLPVDAALSHPADAIVGVSLSGRNPSLGMAAPTHQTAEEGGVEVPWTQRVTETLLATPLGRRLAALAAAAEEISEERRASEKNAVEKGMLLKAQLFDPLPSKLTSRNMTMIALDTMQQAIEVTRTAATPPDVYISVPMSSASTFEFHRAPELIELGRELAAEAFDRVGI